MKKEVSRMNNGSNLPFSEEQNINNSEAALKAPKPNRKIASVYDYVETFCYALALMLVLFLFVFRYVSVDGQSMRETLQNNDKLIISNLFYKPKTGDIVVIKPNSDIRGNNEPLIKRVIATGGQKVRIDYANWEVYVDGKKLDEPYIEGMREPGWMNRPYIPRYNKEFTVEENKVFVMGDNRNNSTDSRMIGEISENGILGRVIIRLYPNFGKVR